MPKFTSQILLLFSKVLHILEKLLLKNFTGLKLKCPSKLTYFANEINVVVLISCLPRIEYIIG